MSTVLRKVNKEIEDFKTKQIQIVPGLSFNQYDTIQNIFFYYNSKFRSGDIDDEGDRKYFYNIVKNPCKVFSKSIDFDTKNIRLLTAGGGDPYKTWFMERDLKYWMRDKQFGKVLNRIFKELPVFGSVVLKIVKGTPYFVDLRNFVVEQSADDLSSSNYIIEIHNYTVADFRSAAKQMGWDSSKVKETIDNFHKMRDTSHIRVYERYGEIKDEDAQTWAYKRTFVADVGVDEFDQYGNLSSTKKGVELSSEEWDGNPYWEFHAEKMPGRWLGIGVVETLIEPQIRENELANLQVKASYWAALRLWQTRDPGANRNQLIDARNGELLTVDSEITQVDMADRNLGFFRDETQKWLQNRAELTFSYDVVQGERLPAGTPLGSAQLSISQTLSYFEGIQENVALDVKEMLFSDIIPQFQKESTPEHTIRLIGEDLDTYTQMVKNDLVNKQMVKMAVESLTGKPFPTSQDADVAGIVIEESIKQGKEKILTIPKGFFDEMKYDVDIDITGESLDTRVRSATRFAILQAISADPAMLTDPVKKKIIFGIAEDGGLNPAELFGAEKKSIGDVLGPQAPAQSSSRAGGGVSAPAMAQGAMPGSGNTVTV